MGESGNKIGSIVWVDLSVPNADQIRDFYSKVVGWKPEPVDMGDYDDYNMYPMDGIAPAAGVCHARGANQEIPSLWLVYITVEDLDRSLRECLRLGGEVILDRRQENGSGFCIIRDPAGAVAALYRPAED